MTTVTPYEVLTGPYQVYLAPFGEAFPAVGATPAGNWELIGYTKEEQLLTIDGDLELIYSNEHQGPIKAVRPEETPVFTFTMQSMTQEDLARVLNDVSKLVVAVGPPATQKMPLQRGYIPPLYALMLLGASQSPYGDLPGFFAFPKVVIGGSPELNFQKDEETAIEVEVTVIADITQADPDDELGWWIVQTA